MGLGMKQLTLATAGFERYVKTTRRAVTFPRKVDTGLCGFCLCLLWSDVADGGVDPRTIVIAFDISEQFAPRGIAVGVFAVVDQLGFRSAEEALHWRIVPASQQFALRLIEMAAVCRMSRYW